MNKKVLWYGYLIVTANTFYFGPALPNGPGSLPGVKVIKLFFFFATDARDI
jgi:hypothetical protein